MRPAIQILIPEKSLAGDMSSSPQPALAIHCRCSYLDIFLTRDLNFSIFQNESVSHPFK